MMLFCKRVSITLISLLCLSVANAAKKTQVEYTQPINSVEQAIKGDIIASGVVSDTTTFIEETFRLTELLYIEFGGLYGPLYDPEINTIFIPYSFMHEVETRFQEVNYNETGISAKDATMDALMHTLFHELAHALIALYDLPVVGKEEDAADALANILLIEYFDNGADIAISAADLFDLESTDIIEFEENDFSGEHSLDVQRFYSIMCHVYGSDPETYSELIKEFDFSKERAELCVFEYENLLHGWLTLLTPYMK